MKTCENCIHHDLCSKYFYVGELCGGFKDKSKFIELPCSIGDTVWTIVHQKLSEAKVVCIRPFVFDNCIEYRGNVVVKMRDPFYLDDRLLEQEFFVVFGKDTFLTQEEANKKLEELKHEKERT